MTSDMMMVAAMVAAALSAITFALGVLLLIVIPTKFKLQSLLSDRKVFEAEQRERQKLLDQLKKDWAKDFNRSDGLDNDNNGQADFQPEWLTNGEPNPLFGTGDPQCSSIFDNLEG